MLPGIEASAGAVPQPKTGVAPADAKQAIMGIAFNKKIKCTILTVKFMITTLFGNDNDTTYEMQDQILLLKYSPVSF